MLRFQGVQYDCTVKVPFWSVPLRVECLVERAKIGDELRVEFVRASTRETVSAPVRLEENRNVFRRMWPEFDRVRYCARGGVVVQPLVANLLDREVSQALQWKLSSLVDNPDTKARGMAIVTHVMAKSPFLRTRGVEVGDVVVAVNDVRVNRRARGADPFEQYVRAWEQLGEGALVTIHTRDGCVAAASAETISEVDEEIRQSNIALVVR